jgi:hypothetical protein
MRPRCDHYSPASPCERVRARPRLLRPSERITAICGEKVRDTARPGKRTTGLEPATFGLGSQRSYVGTALFGARAEATCDPPRSRSRRPSPAARSCNSKWAPQVRSGSDPTRVALPMLWLRRGSSVGQSTALVKRGSRVRIPSPAPRGPRCSSAPRQQSGVCHARSWPKKTAKSRLNGRKMRPDAGSASRWTFLTSEVLYQLGQHQTYAHVWMRQKVRQKIAQNRSRASEPQTLIATPRHEGPAYAHDLPSLVARPTGFEPVTFGSVDRRSIQLSYGRSGVQVSAGAVVGDRERRGRDSNPRWSVNPILA